MVSPAVLVHGNKGQHINWSLEQIKAVAPAIPVKTVFRHTPHRVALVSGGRTSTTLIGVAGDTIFIEPYEHHVVVLRGFVNHLFVNESVKHVFIDASPVQQVGEHPPRIIVGRR